MQERTQRQLRVGEQIRHAIAECISHGHFSDEVLYHNVQKIIISEVRISPDLKNATAFTYTVGGKDIPKIVKSLNNEAKAFQSFIGRNLGLKFTPKVRFREDSSFENANHIEMLLHRINTEKS
jgi:ribosome-binding factor A